MTQTRGAFGRLRELLAPPEVFRGHERVQELFEPPERVPVVEDDRGDRATVELAVGAHDAVPEPLDDRLAHLVAAEQHVHDLVARHGRGAAAPKRCERFALSCADAAGDRDG